MILHGSCTAFGKEQDGILYLYHPYAAQGDGEDHQPEVYCTV